MALHPAATPPLHSAQDAIDAVAEYARLRQRLEDLNRADVKDMRAIDQVIDRLAAAQLAVKAAHGLIGNNPLDE